MFHPQGHPRSGRKRTLTAEEVLRIRELKSQGMTQKAIAIRFGVSNACISLIVRGKRHRGQ